MKNLPLTRAPRDNTDAEIEAFTTVCERLGGFDERLSAEWIDGYLTALASGPRSVPLDEWLPKMAGDAYERAFGDPDDRAAAEQALLARTRVLADQLDAEAIDTDPDALRLSPLMSAWDEAARAELVAAGSIDAEGAADLVTGGLWADGFFAGAADFLNATPSDVDEEEQRVLTALLQQLQALRLPEGSDALKQHIQVAYLGEAVDRERLVDEACYAVQDLRLWWVDHAPRPETRRVEKPPGRNDPCPCGSGKKFKKCHGA